MSNAALAFFSGLGSGYIQGKDIEDKKAREDKRDAREQEEHDARMAERRAKIDGDKALRMAATPATVANGATVTGVSAQPTVYDNVDMASSDVRQAKRLAQLPAAAGGIPAGPADTPAGLGQASAPAVSMTPASVVNGTAYADQASADAAAAAANTPAAIHARQVAALDAIDPERARKLEATTLTVDSARAEQAKKLRDEGVFDTVQAARRGDAQGVFDAFNKNGKMKLEGVPTVTPEIRDIPGVGKVQTYTYTGKLVAPDGTVSAFQKNSHDLSMEVMPYEKAIEVQQKGTKEAREAKKSDAEVDELGARAGYYRAAAGAQGAKAEATANGGGKPFKLDEDDKLRLTTANTRVRDAEKAVTEAMGKLMPGDDPNKAPGVQYAQNLLRQAKLDHMRTNIELGQIPAASMVTQIMSVAKGPQDVLKSLNEIASVGGTEYADQVAAKIQATDQWKQWNTKKAAPKPAAAGGMGPTGAGAAPAAIAPRGAAGASAASAPRGAAPASVPAPAPQAAPSGDALAQRLQQAREVVQRLRGSAPPPGAGRDAIDAYQLSMQYALEDEKAAQTRFDQSRRPAAASGLVVAQ